MNWDTIACRLGYTNFKAMFIRLYTVEKKTLRVIATELGCTVPTVKRLLVSEGLVEYLRPRGVKTPFLTEDELLGTLDEAAEKTGLSRSTLWYRRKKSKEMIAEMTRIMNLTIESESDKKDSPSTDDDPT